MVKKTYKHNLAIIVLLVSTIFIDLGYAQAQSKKVKNVLFIIVDDLRPELKSFGASYIVSPNIDKLAATGRPSTNQYVAAQVTCYPLLYQ